jgi:hypothetical protein
MPKINLDELEDLMDDEVDSREIERLRRKENTKEKKRQIQKEYHQRKRLQYRF